MELCVSKGTSTTNPFHDIVDSLTDQWQRVTLDYLYQIGQKLKPHNIPLETYGDTFKVLEFLAEHGAIELQNNENEHLIRKAQYLG